MTQNRFGITFNPAPAPLWVYALPRAESRLPANDERQWRWLRLDRITQIMTELGVGHPADESDQHMVTITVDGEQYHPTAMLVKGDEIESVELYVIDYVNRALAVLAKGRQG
ncbi:hypothetical protein [Xanthomonas perforans]|uniref:hypothetical protein n=1 Tax=Xanthomonas perforans TaxID=442694 RepID=UPI00062D3625|nr:hypothetical protein [Xanthomonas perforans]KLC55098.1 hypothetical protein XP1815_00180 [Xanthomonas perforans]